MKSLKENCIPDVHFYGRVNISPSTCKTIKLVVQHLLFRGSGKGNAFIEVFLVLGEAKATLAETKEQMFYLQWTQLTIHTPQLCEYTHTSFSSVMPPNSYHMFQVQLNNRKNGSFRNRENMPIFENGRLEIIFMRRAEN